MDDCAGADDYVNVNGLWWHITPLFGRRASQHETMIAEITITLYLSSDINFCIRQKA